MAKRRKDILKRKYIAPEVYFEQAEPWEMIAATAPVKGPDITGEGTNDDTDDAKANLFWFEDNYNDEEDF